MAGLATNLKQMRYVRCGNIPISRIIGLNMLAANGACAMPKQTSCRPVVSNATTVIRQVQREIGRKEMCVEFWKWSALFLKVYPLSVDNCRPRLHLSDSPAYWDCVD